METIITARNTDRKAFEVTSASGHTITIESASAGLPTEGPGPMETLLASLATCAGATVHGLLTKMRQEFTNLEVQVSGERAEHSPRMWTAIALHYRVEGAVDPERLERAIELAETKHCSVSAHLAASVKIVTTYEIIA